MSVARETAGFLEEMRSAAGSPHTLQAVAGDLAKLAAYAGSLQPDAIKPAHVRSYVAAEHRKGLAAASLKRMLSSWRRFFDALAARDAVRMNPARGVRAPRAGKALPKVLTPDEANALLAAGASASGDIGARDAAMFELAYSSALRVSELVGLDDGDVDEDEKLVRVRHGKGNKERLVPAGRIALAAVAKWKQVRSGWSVPAGGALFVNRRGGRLTARSAQYRIANMARAACLPAKVSPHILRHSCASHLLQSSGDLRAVQEFLGHADVSSTQVYTHLDFQALAAVYDRAHPRAKRKQSSPTDSKD